MKEIPPFPYVVIYFDQTNCSEAEARLFYDHYQASGWMTPTGAAVKNWKAAARDWIWQLMEKSAYRRNKSKA